VSASDNQLGYCPSHSPMILPMEIDGSEAPLQLSLENEVASRDAASAFLTAVSLRSAQEPFEHTPASVWACETLLDVRQAIGSEGIRAWLDYVDEFSERIS
jgi:hypothetical protein